MAHKKRNDVDTNDQPAVDGEQEETGYVRTPRTGQRFVPDVYQQRRDTTIRRRH